MQAKPAVAVASVVAAAGLVAGIMASSASAAGNRLTVTVVTASGNAPIGVVTTLTATCPAGTLAVGGGYDNSGLGFDSVSSHVILNESVGTPPNGWKIEVANNSGSNTNPVSVQALCAAAN